MKAIQNCLQKIVIYKIYSLEKQKMEYNDNLSVRLFNELRNNSTLIVCVTILCFSAKYFFVKHLKQKNMFRQFTKNIYKWI